MQVVFVYTKGLWSAAGVLPAVRACTGEQSSQRLATAPGPIKMQTFQKSKAKATGLSTGCRAPCEPGAPRPQQPPPRRFGDLSNTHAAKPGERDPGITVRHKKLLYFSSYATPQDCQKRNSVPSQINLLWDILKILLLLNLLKVYFLLVILPGFSSYQPTPLLEGARGWDRHWDSQSRGVRANTQAPLPAK